MPTLNWIGKDKVINHHQEVPYKILNSNILIAMVLKLMLLKVKTKLFTGDNLETLKTYYTTI